MQICDDLTDPHRKLLIEESKYLFIPMEIEGLTCEVITHPPTNNELHEYQQILLSD